MEQLLSMSKIFSEKIFRIPDYQRGYAWTLKEVKDFWGDLCRLENKKNHYVGVLTLEPAKEEDYKKWIDDLWIIDAKRYIPFYVVDGQQRLTTSIILIYVICHAFIFLFSGESYTHDDQNGCQQHDAYHFGDGGGICHIASRSIDGVTRSDYMSYFV